MKFKNIKANLIEEVDDSNKALIAQMKAYPEVYQPIDEKAKPAKEAEAPKEAQKEEPKEAEAPKAKK